MKQDIDYINCKTTDKAVLDLWDKVRKLEVDEYLVAGFGPFGKFTIKNEDGYLVFRGRDSRDSSIREDRWYRELTTPESIVAIVYSYPEIYAENNYTHEMKHWDNWVSFLNSFKTKLKDGN